MIYTLIFHQMYLDYDDRLSYFYAIKVRLHIQARLYGKQLFTSGKFKVYPYKNVVAFYKHSLFFYWSQWRSSFESNWMLNAWWDKFLPLNTQKQRVFILWPKLTLFPIMYTIYLSLEVLMRIFAFIGWISFNFRIGFLNLNNAGPLAQEGCREESQTRCGEQGGRLFYWQAT